MNQYIMYKKMKVVCKNRFRKLMKKYNDLMYNDSMLDLKMNSSFIVSVFYTSLFDQRIL